MSEISYNESNLPVSYDFSPAENMEKLSPVASYLGTLAKGSRPAMLQAANRWARVASFGRCDASTFDWSMLSPSLATALRAHAQAQVDANVWAHTTANKNLAALRGIARAAWRLSQIDTEDYQRIADLPGLRGTRARKGREVNHDQRVLLLSIDSSSPAASARDRAIIGLLYGCGLRRAEIIVLTEQSLNDNFDEVRIRGKGDRERLVPLPEDSQGLLQNWLQIRGHDPGPIFCVVSKSGEPQPATPLTGEAIRQMLQRKARAAGIPLFSPHDLRRTYAGDLLDAGADLPTVAAMMGHASVVSTAQYDRRGVRAAREAASRLTI